MKVKFKKLDPKAVPPYRKDPLDAGWDLTAVSKTISLNNKIVYNTGIAVEIPKGYVGLLFPKSGVSNKDLILSNCVGVIDSSYRGPIIVNYTETGDKNHVYQVNDRICQLIIMPYPEIEWEETNELSNTFRGDKGFGEHTGK